MGRARRRAGVPVLDVVDGGRLPRWTGPSRWSSTTTTSPIPSSTRDGTRPRPAARPARWSSWPGWPPGRPWGWPTAPSTRPTWSPPAAAGRRWSRSSSTSTGWRPRPIPGWPPAWPPARPPAAPTGCSSGAWSRPRPSTTWSRPSGPTGASTTRWPGCTWSVPPRRVGTWPRSGTSSPISGCKRRCGSPARCPTRPWPPTSARPTSTCPLSVHEGFGVPLLEAHAGVGAGGGPAGRSGARHPGRRRAPAGAHRAGAGGGGRAPGAGRPRPAGPTGRRPDGSRVAAAHLGRVGPAGRRRHRHRGRASAR